IVFEVPGDQGVCYAPNVWHHPLLVFEPADFLVVDRDRPEDNLEEARYDTPYPVLL
ncbi:MAG: ureidoglycolate lyase, partial [Pseudomonadota bacterium]